MSGTQPVGVYAMKVPPGGILLPAVPDFAAMFRVSMAAIDPTEEPFYEEDDTEKKAPRSTLKIVRVPGDMFGDDEDDSEDDDEMDLLNGLGEDSDEELEEEEINGGPSEPKNAKSIIGEAEDDEADDDDDEDMEDPSDEDDAQAIKALQKIMKGKGKAKAEGSDDEDDEEEDDDDDSLELEEVVVCTLDPEKNCQQTLDFVVGEDERVFFKVTGTHTIHLTGNYVIPMDDGQAQLYDDDDEEDYDLSPDEEELDADALDALEDGEESDELDDLEDPRVTEVTSEEEAPKLLKTTGKGKNKRPAEDSEEEEANLDDLIATSLKKEEKEEAVPATNGDAKKLSKAEKKALKKLKKNDGAAAPIALATNQTPELKKEAAATNGNEKKSVQFAKNLEQGPTPSTTPPAKAADKKADSAKTSDKAASLGSKDVQGVTIDDRKLGTGPASKKGSRVEMRYIGKLENGKVFDSNKKGKPFSFKLGMGEVIKGWDIGVAGMSVGGERRLTIPAHHGYGKKGAPPDIPPNSKLIFDIKCVGVY